MIKVSIGDIVRTCDGRTLFVFSGVSYMEGEYKCVDSNGRIFFIASTDVNELIDHISIGYIYNRIREMETFTKG